MRQRFKRKYDLIILFLNFISYYFCASRAVCLSIILAVILHQLILSWPSFIKLFIAPFTSCLLLIFLTFSVFIPSYLDLNHGWLAKLDLLLSFRITIMKRALRLYPLTFGGYGDMFQNIHDPSNYLVLDNGYISLFVERGIIMGLFIIAAILLLIYKANKTHDLYLLLYLFVFVVANCIDASFLLYKSLPIYCILINTGTPHYVEWVTHKQKFKQKETLNSHYISGLG